VAHACNPRRQRSGELLFEASRANSLKDPILKKMLHKKRAGGVAQGAGSEFKSQYCQKDLEPWTLPLSPRPSSDPIQAPHASTRVPGILLSKSLVPALAFEIQHLKPGLLSLSLRYRLGNPGLPPGWVSRQQEVHVSYLLSHDIISKL
jgi:hypothetical protein